MDMFPYPIKLVSLRKEDIQKNRGMGGENKVFQEVTRDLREHFAGKVNEISNLFEKRFQRYPNIPSVAKVKLRPDAIAKSHRPTSLFTENTCPIVGVGTSNELFIEVTPDGLSNLTDKIVNSDAKITKANISTLDDLVPYSKEDVLTNEAYNLIKESGQKVIKVKLFDFHQQKTNNESDKTFIQHLHAFDSELIKKISYTKDLMTQTSHLKRLVHRMCQ
jgi:serine protease AprX